jgi:hypothetical protein
LRWAGRSSNFHPVLGRVARRAMSNFLIGALIPSSATEGARVTIALCLKCGSTKWGALCPCPTCQAGASGYFNLDIAFSDHRLSRATLEQFGAVIKAIADRTDHQDLRFWSFIEYVSRNHPDILSVALEPDVRERVEAVLLGLEVPPIEVRQPPRLSSWAALLWLALLALGVWWFFLRG